MARTYGYRSLSLLLLLFIPALSRAQVSCLWLNAATASGVLGGPVTTTVSRANARSSKTHAANAISGAGPTSANASSDSYSGNGIDDSDCAFIRQPQPAAGELRIAVRTMSEPRKELASYSARCGARATSLKAIGSEAVACRLKGKSGELVEQVVGRVRDRAFTVRLNTNDSSITESLLRKRAQKVAEQVAGNLF